MVSFELRLNLNIPVAFKKALQDDLAVVLQAGKRSSYESEIRFAPPRWLARDDR